MKQKFLFENVEGNQFKVSNESSASPHLTGIDEQDLEEAVIDLCTALKAFSMVAMETENKSIVSDTTNLIYKLTDAIEKKIRQLEQQRSQTVPTGVDGIKNSLRGTEYK